MNMSTAQGDTVYNTSAKTESYLLEKLKPTRVYDRSAMMSKYFQKKTRYRSEGTENYLFGQMKKCKSTASKIRLGSL